MANNTPEKQTVLISGLPGKMATLVAEGVDNSSDLRLSSFALSSEKHATSGAFKAIGTRPISLIAPENHLDTVKSVQQLGGIIVDFTRPDVINRNAELYVQVGVPFVMGTTGGDRQKLSDAVRQSKISAVIAPNMATPMVIVQAMLEYASQTFPNALEGWALQIAESHQSAKKDVSGTAKAWWPLLEALGATMTGSIKSDRADPAPHAYHTVILGSTDGNTEVEFDTRISGRSVYVGGTLQAIRFLAEKVRLGSQGEVFSMIDVLRR